MFSRIVFITSWTKCSRLGLMIISVQCSAISMLYECFSCPLVSKYRKEVIISTQQTCGCAPLSLIACQAGLIINKITIRSASFDPPMNKYAAQRDTQLIVTMRKVELSSLSLATGFEFCYLLNPIYWGPLQPSTNIELFFCTWRDSSRWARNESR